MYSTQVSVLSTTANYVMTVSLEQNTQNTQLQGVAGVGTTLRNHKQTLSNRIVRCTSKIFDFFCNLDHLSSPSTILLLVSISAPLSECPQCTAVAQSCSRIPTKLLWFPLFPTGVRTIRKKGPSRVCSSSTRFRTLLGFSITTFLKVLAKAPFKHLPPQNNQNFNPCLPQTRALAKM